MCIEVLLSVGWAKFLIGKEFSNNYELCGLQYQVTKGRLMNDQDISKCINRYFKQPTVDRNNLARLFQYIQQFAVRNWQVQMIQKLFKIAEDNMTKENLKVIVKRYLHLINEILEKDQKILPQFRYQFYISGQIVPQFISILKNIFKYGPIELFPEIKLYRKRWAKRISDQAYGQMHTEAQRQLKIDLDKGFSDENVKKLAKSYQKRQFSQSEIEKYLPSTNSQTSTSQNRKSSAISQSSQDNEVKPHKKIKRESQGRYQETVASNRSQYNSDLGMPRHSSYIPSNTNSYGNGFAVDPRRPYQILYHPMQQVHPSNPYYPQTRVNNSVVGQPNNYYPFPQSGYLPTAVGPYGYNVPYNYSNTHYQNNYQNAPYDPNLQVRREPGQQANPKIVKLLQKIDAVKKGWFFQCKLCGLHISTNQRYDQHMFQHFSEAQKQYEVSHSRTDHTRKGNKPLLPSLQEWIQSNRIKLTDQKFLIPIEGQISRNEACIICKSEMKISWSDQMDCWVYEDAIRTKLKSFGNKASGVADKNQNKPSICHSECYHIIDQFERSSDEISK